MFLGLNNSADNFMDLVYFNYVGNVNIVLSKRTIMQFIFFCVIGVSNAVVQLGIYYLLLLANVYYLASNIIAFFFSVMNSYIWNKKITFKDRKATKLTIVKIYLSYGITTLLGTGFLYLLVDIIGLNKYIGPVINIMVVTGINFLFQKYFVFREGV
jgi:putative flippase GtrA